MQRERQREKKKTGTNQPAIGGVRNARPWQGIEGWRGQHVVTKLHSTLRNFLTCTFFKRKFCFVHLTAIYPNLTEIYLRNKVGKKGHNEKNTRKELNFCKKDNKLFCFFVVGLKVWLKPAWFIVHAGLRRASMVSSLWPGDSCDRTDHSKFGMKHLGES